MKYLLVLVSFVSMPTYAADLSTDDITGISFWLVPAAMLAATVFFFVERDNIIVCCWSRNRSSLLALPLYERSMGRHSGFTNSIQIH